MNATLRAIFLDAGNTLLFPQLESIVLELEAAGFPATVEQFHEAERRGKRRLDEALWPQIRERRVPRAADQLYWKTYLDALMERMEATPEDRARLIDLVVAKFRNIRTWSRVLPETLPTLSRLKTEGYFLAVISNSDGTVEGELQRAGLTEYLEFVIDSAVVGVEKPHPEIFQLALDRAGVEPQQALYVGDTYATDVGGAQLAGLGAVLMDRVGAYPDATCPRITSLSELSGVLEQTRQQTEMR